MRQLVLCNKQIIEHLAKTMSAKTEANKSDSKILIIATHKDKVRDFDIPKKLNDLVRGIFPSHALYNEQRSKSVFDVNLLDPDKETLPRIRQNIFKIWRKIGFYACPHHLFCSSMKLWFT